MIAELYPDLTWETDIQEKQKQNKIDPNKIITFRNISSIN
jgi:hypothetical protein